MKGSKIVVGSALMVGLVSPGCVNVNEDCPTSPEVSVALEPGSEDVRDLPVIESGARQLLGIDVADSHGEVAAISSIEGAQRVDLVGVSFDVTVADEPLGIEITRQTSGGEELEDHPVLSTDSDLRTFFRADDLSDIALPQGAEYTATYRVEWKKEFPSMCPSVREGVATVEVPGHVAAAVEAGSFAVRGTDANEAQVPEATGGAKFKLFAEIDSGLEVTIRDVSATVTYIGTGGTLPALGLATIEDLAVLVDGQTSDTVGPDQVVEIYSTKSPSQDPPPYEAAGTSATTGDVGGGKALIEVTIEYELNDGTPGLQTDTLVHAVDVEESGGLL